MLTGKQLIEDLHCRFAKEISRSEEETPGKVFITIKPKALIPLADYVINTCGFRFLVNVGSDQVPFKRSLCHFVYFFP